jgi:hypothetical protein
LGGDFALARTAAIEFPLNVIIRQINPRRTTVDNDSDPTPVRFAEGGDAKKLAKTVAHVGARIIRQCTSTTEEQA